MIESDGTLGLQEEEKLGKRKFAFVGKQKDENYMLSLLDLKFKIIHITMAKRKAAEPPQGPKLNNKQKKNQKTDIQDAPKAAISTFKNKEKVLVVSSRGITFRYVS
jgi:folylpolyglutamate synthase/dihydropteroate synthase